MKHTLTVFAVLFLLMSCDEDRIKVNSNIQDLSRQYFTPGQSVPIKVESNGNIAVRLDDITISSGEAFAVGENFHFGINHLKLVATGKKDSVSYPFSVTVIPAEAPKALSWTLANTYPHPVELFTQGLVVDGEWVLESSGQFNESALSRYRLGSREIVQQYKLPDNWFGEGLALAGDSLYQITWRQNVGMTYAWNGTEFTPGKEFSYSGYEGWGLAAYGGHLLWTDGSARIRRVEPHSKKVADEFYAVSSEGLLGNLNESEMYKGLLAVNLWQTDRIAFINPQTGVAQYVLDLGKIAQTHHASGTLNGIAVVNGNLLITGKNWPLMYEIEVDFPEGN